MASLNLTLKTALENKTVAINSKHSPAFYFDTDTNEILGLVSEADAVNAYLEKREREADNAE